MLGVQSWMGVGNCRVYHTYIAHWPLLTYRSSTHTVSKFLADFAVCDWWRCCKAQCDGKVLSKCGKWSNISSRASLLTFSNSVGSKEGGNKLRSRESRTTNELHVRFLITKQIKFRFQFFYIRSLKRNENEHNNLTKN